MCSHYGTLDIIQHTCRVGQTGRSATGSKCEISAISVMSQNSGPYACACGTEVEKFHILQHTKSVSTLDEPQPTIWGGGVYFHMFQSCNLPIKYEVFGLKWWLGIAGIKAGTSYHDSAVKHLNQNWPYLQYSC